MEKNQTKKHLRGGRGVDLLGGEKKLKALILLSGGLDSMLAAKILIEQSIEVTGLIFKSYFFDEKKGVKAAKQLGISCYMIDFSKEHLEIVKKPPHGYGKASNPCIDCHLLMLKIARRILEWRKFSRIVNRTPLLERKHSYEPGKKYDFVATGEVLGERPFSQNKQALEIITKKSGLNDRLLRPLSAQLLPITLPEKKGWVNRKKLLAIQGRRRQEQMALAKKYNLTYPSPGGGCILTEKEFAKKLFDLFKKWPDCDGDDVRLLFFGRHFWHHETTSARWALRPAPNAVLEKALLGGGVKYTKIVLGKNQEENEKLEKLAKKSDILIIPTNFPGPTALIRLEGVTFGKVAPSTTKKAKSLISSYSKKLPAKPSFQIHSDKS